MAIINTAHSPRYAPNVPAALRKVAPRSHHHHLKRQTIGCDYELRRIRIMGRNAGNLERRRRPASHSVPPTKSSAAGQVFSLRAWSSGTSDPKPSDLASPRPCHNRRSRTNSGFQPRRCVSFKGCIRHLKNVLPMPCWNWRVIPSRQTACGELEQLLLSSCRRDFWRIMTAWKTWLYIKDIPASTRIYRRKCRQARWLRSWRTVANPPHPAIIRRTCCRT